MMRERHAVVSFSYLLYFRGQINLPNKGVMHVNPLYPVPTGLIRGVDDYLLHKFPQKRRGQFGGFGVLLHNFQKLWILTVWVSAASTIIRRFSTDCFKSACSFS